MIHQPLTAPLVIEAERRANVAETSAAKALVELIKVKAELAKVQEELERTKAEHSRYCETDHEVYHQIFMALGILDSKFPYDGAVEAATRLKADLANAQRHMESFTRGMLFTIYELAQVDHERDNHAASEAEVNIPSLKVYVVNALHKALSTPAAKGAEETPVPESWPVSASPGGCNPWFLRADKFIALVSTRPSLWLSYSAAKYINIRIDTRDCSFVLRGRNDEELSMERLLTVMQENKFSGAYRRPRASILQADTPHATADQVPDCPSTLWISGEQPPLSPVGPNSETSYYRERTDSMNGNGGPWYCSTGKYFGQMCPEEGCAKADGCFRERQAHPPASTPLGGEGM